jgi:hypothetical protein
MYLTWNDFVRKYLVWKEFAQKNLFPWKELLQQKIISLEIVSMKTVCLEKVYQNIV